jgi:alpha-L-rhamnosidase
MLVASSEEVLRSGRADLWDSGKVTSDESIGIEYRGRDLTSRQRCWWCVRAWDTEGNASSFSEASGWEMGLLSPVDWSAEWLAVENEVEREDREAGYQWIWRASTATAKVLLLRSFRLDEATSGGRFFVVTSRVELLGIRLDGSAVRCRMEPSPSVQIATSPWAELPPLSRGEHVIEIEAQAPPALAPLSLDPEVQFQGIAFFARLDVPPGGSYRIGSDSAWRCSDENSVWAPPKTWLPTKQQPWPEMAAMQLRRSFSVDRTPVKARLYATALGIYEARLNGRRVGDALLTPEISKYQTRVLYQIYDVADLIESGPNAIGLIVADGWFGGFEGRFTWMPPPRRVLAQLELVFSDGSRQIVSTGPDWRIGASPIRRSDVRVGEIYDAQFEQAGWDTGRFDDRHWSNAHVAPSPPCRLTAQISPPVRVVQTLKPHAISQPRPGAHVVDFGQNFSGWMRLRVREPGRTRIELRFAETQKHSGDIDVESMGTLMGRELPHDVFFTRGDGTAEVLEPHFSYRGFRYVEITGLSTAPEASALEGIAIQSDLKQTGVFRSDSPLAEKLWRASFWTQRSNLVAIPTDCPSREQRGYLGDAGLSWDAFAFNMNIAPFGARFVDAIFDEQLPDGAIYQLAPAPDPMRFARIGSVPGWADGAVIILWTHWRHYGSAALIEQYWSALDRYSRFVLEANPDFVWRNKRAADYGDWLALQGDLISTDLAEPGTTPKDLIATAFWAHSTDLLSQMANAIGRVEDADRLRDLHKRICRAFTAAFVQPGGFVGNGSQAGYVLALQFRLLPEAMRAQAAEHLVGDIRKRGVSLTTGILATCFILDVLADNGHADLAYGLLLRTGFPSWGHMLAKGATTIWETWTGSAAFRGTTFDMSKNHFTLAAAPGTFLFRRVAGIDAAAPGFRKIEIHPLMDPRIRRGGASYESIRGTIATEWSRAPEGHFVLDVTVPPNATACVHLPARRDNHIEEGRRDVSRRNDIRVLSRLDAETRVEIGSGSYRFTIFSEDF